MTSDEIRGKIQYYEQLIAGYIEEKVQKQIRRSSGAAPAQFIYACRDASAQPYLSCLLQRHAGAVDRADVCQDI